MISLRYVGGQILKGIHFFVRHLGLAIIITYQKLCSPFFPAHCRFYPSCSQYAKQALLSPRLKLYQAFWLIFKRLAKCHPAHPGGIDLIIDKEEAKNKITKR